MRFFFLTILLILSTLFAKAQNNEDNKTTIYLTNKSVIHTMLLSKTTPASSKQILIEANGKTFPLTDINYLERNNYWYKVITKPKNGKHHLYQRSKDGRKLDLYFKTNIKIDEVHKKNFMTKYEKYEDESGNFLNLNLRNLTNSVRTSDAALKELNKTKFLKVFKTVVILSGLSTTIYGSYLILNYHNAPRALPLLGPVILLLTHPIGKAIKNHYINSIEIYNKG